MSLLSLRILPLPTGLVDLGGRRIRNSGGRCCSSLQAPVIRTCPLERQLIDQIVVGCGEAAVSEAVDVVRWVTERFETS